MQAKNPCLGIIFCAIFLERMMSSTRRNTPLRAHWKAKIQDTLDSYVAALCEVGRVRLLVEGIITDWPTRSTTPQGRVDGIPEGPRILLNHLIKFIKSEHWDAGNPVWVGSMTMHLDRVMGSTKRRQAALNWLIDHGLVVDLTTANGRSYRAHDEVSGLSLRPILLRLRELEETVARFTQEQREHRQLCKHIRSARAYIRANADLFTAPLPEYVWMSPNWKPERLHLDQLKAVVPQVNQLASEASALEEEMFQQFDKNVSQDTQKGALLDHNNPYNGIATQCNQTSNEVVVEAVKPIQTRRLERLKAMVFGKARRELSRKDLEPILKLSGLTGTSQDISQQLAKQAGVRHDLLDQWIRSRGVETVISALLLARYHQKAKTSGGLARWWLEKTAHDRLIATYLNWHDKVVAGTWVPK